MSGTKFRDIRKRLKLTQAKLGRMFDVSRNTIRVYETAAEVPPMAALAIRELRRQMRLRKRQKR